MPSSFVFVGIFFIDLVSIFDLTTDCRVQSFVSKRRPIFLRDAGVFFEDLDPSLESGFLGSPDRQTGRRAGTYDPPRAAAYRNFQGSVCRLASQYRLDIQIQD